MIGAISSNGTANMSCSTKARRSAGVSRSSTTSSASPTESARSASCSGLLPRVLVRDRLRRVRGERLLTSRLPRPQHVEAHARDDRGQPSAKVVDLRAIDAAEPQPRFLNGVVHLAQRAEHPVGHGAQVGSVRFESLGQKLVFAHRVLSEGLRPSDSLTRSLARRFAAALRSRGSLAMLARTLERASG
jgi:hypothetical protein